MKILRITQFSRLYFQLEGKRVNSLKSNQSNKPNPISSSSLGRDWCTDEGFLGEESAHEDIFSNSVSATFSTWASWVLRINSETLLKVMNGLPRNFFFSFAWITPWILANTNSTGFTASSPRLRSSTTAWASRRRFSWLLLSDGRIFTYFREGARFFLAL